MGNIKAEKKNITLRDYQQDCVASIMAQPTGTSMLVIMATGLGKTATFANLPRSPGEKMLILTMGRELVLNPVDYFPFPVAIEMAEHHASREMPDAEVMVASVQSICKEERLQAYAPDAFDYIIVDEAHHAVAPSFRKVLGYFTPKKYLIGFTATPTRFDGESLRDIFSTIVFNHDIQWGIENGYLCDIYSVRAKIDVDLSRVTTITRATGEKDYNSQALAKAMAKCAPAIIDVYREYAFGPTLIFVAGRSNAKAIAKGIPGAVAITGDMKAGERKKHLDDFLNGRTRCLVSVDVLREGVDLPNTTSIIFARPTMSATVYTQIIGRGLRNHPGKKFLNLIEVDGIMGENVSLFTAASLAGIDLAKLSPQDREKFNRVKFSEMRDRAATLADTPESWALNAQSVDLWSDLTGYDTHGVNWYQLPDGTFELRFQNKETNEVFFGQIPAPDALGRTTFGMVRMPLQMALDLYWDMLKQKYPNLSILWDKTVVDKFWGNKPASPKQRYRIQKSIPGYDCSNLSQKQANGIISRLESKAWSENTGILPKYPVVPDEIPSQFYQMETVKQGRKTVCIYDYNPGNEYIVDEKAAYLIISVREWLIRCMRTGYFQMKKDGRALVDRVNRSDRMDYAKLFLQNHSQYRFLSSINGRHYPRRDLLEWLARLCDILVADALNIVCLHPEYLKMKGKRKKADLSVVPLNALKFTFPESEKIVSDSRAIKITTSREQKRQEMTSWAKKKTAAEKERREISKNVTAKKPVKKD